MSSEELEREVASLRVLVDFLIGAAPHFDLHYYPTGSLVDQKKAVVMVDGVVVEEKMVGGRVVGRSFSEDLKAAIARSEEARNG